MRVSLTRRVGFHATHFLRLPELSEAENRARFGSTVDPHSHDYTCDVTVNGTMVRGMVMDVSRLDEVLAERVVDPLDGSSLNQAIPVCARQEALPTCETVAAWCWNELAPALPSGVDLERVRVAEDATLHAECTGTL
ncbi:MAG TPA: 6-carboxytetrahydropterin synthase [Gemmatimonadales bacterium]